MMSMKLGTSRIRLNIIRVLGISLTIVFLLQFVTLLTKNDDDGVNENYTGTVGSILAESFWKKISNEDRHLTDQQRVERIQSFENKIIKEKLNWTKIFLDNYARKLLKINERDLQTTYKQRFEEDSKINSQQFYDIFEETLVFSRPKFCSSKTIFHPQCPYSNCRWTCDKPSINNENIRRASIFHHVDIKPDEMNEKLKHRSSNDVWILWIDEANRGIESLNQYKFNWTLSFRQDSEVSIGTYGILIEKDTNKSTLDNSFNEDFPLIQLLRDNNIEIADQSLEYRIYLNYRYRHKHALWFVSNCQPQKRLQYYNKLKNYYPINAYGTCVNKKCDKDDHCDNKQSNLALFYLAFESQTCKDYITEKFWRALYYGMIPIVLGPGKQSYLDLGVPKSAFIHVDDYKSASDLAKHLHDISNNYLTYRKYFQWLNQYDVFYDINVLEPIRMCELCMRLNRDDYRNHRFYTDVHQWHRSEC